MFLYSFIRRVGQFRSRYISLFDRPIPIYLWELSSCFVATALKLLIQIIRQVVIRIPVMTSVSQKYNILATCHSGMNSMLSFVNTISVNLTVWILIANCGIYVFVCMYLCILCIYIFHYK